MARVKFPVKELDHLRVYHPDCGRWVEVHSIQLSNHPQYGRTITVTAICECGSRFNYRVEKLNPSDPDLSSVPPSHGVLARQLQS